MTFGDGDHRYELVEDWARLPAGESFRDVASVRIDADDRVFVLNRSDRPVMVFDPGGERVATWGEGEFSDRPHGMGIGPDGNVYCTDDGAHTVTGFTPDGEPLLTLGRENEPSDTGYRDVEDSFERLASITRAAGPFNRPTGVAVADSGDIFVADGYGNARVHAFGPDGELRRSWGSPGPGEGEFRLPHSIGVDGEERVWVADRENSRIQIFDADGTFLAQWRDLIRPTDLCVDGGTVFVSELCNRVSVFTVEGELLTRWGNAGHAGEEPLFLAPHAVAVDSRGDVYVGEVSFTYAGTDRGARTIRKFERRT